MQFDQRRIDIKKKLVVVGDGGEYLCWFTIIPITINIPLTAMD